MLQLSLIKENKQKIVHGLLKRNIANAAGIIDSVLEKDQQRRETQAALDGLLARSNTLSRQIGELMKSGNREEADAVKERTSAMKSESKVLSEQLGQYEKELRALLYTIPNIPHEGVPEGRSSEDNVTVSAHEEVKPLPDGALPHWDLIKKYDIIDFDLGSKVSGAGFPFYKGKGARLQRAMVNFFLDEAIKAGYQEVQPPIVVNQDSGYATGQLPDKEGQMYEVLNENLYLIPTAEVPITNMYRDTILAENELPIKHTGFTPCFRREAGSWGAHVRGLNRLHQFDKVEIVQVVHPDKSYEALEEMRGHIEGLLQKLELPYRVLNLCAGDLGFTSAFTFDLEVYSAAQQQWLEVSSVSNFETYQANRLKLRFRGSDRKTTLAHTLNGSALALPRVMAALLENNQTREGIIIPAVLRDYTGFDMIS